MYAFNFAAWLLRPARKRGGAGLTHAEGEVVVQSGDRRLIEDYLPVDWLSAEASGEPRTKGHISTLHLWRARRLQR